MSTASAYKLTTVIEILFSFTVFVIFHPLAYATHESGGRDQPPNKVTLHDETSFIVRWEVDHDLERVKFQLTVTVDEKGWVLFGLVPASSSSDKEAKKPRIQDAIIGDFVLTWFSSPGHRKTLYLNTIETGRVQAVGNSTRFDYHVTVKSSKENNSSTHWQVVHITRKLDTGDPQDVPITDQPVWIVGAYGNSDVYLTDLSNITSNIDDTLDSKNVIIMSENHTNANNSIISSEPWHHLNHSINSSEPWHKMLKEQLKKHWIGVVIGVAGLLTVVIVAVIYLCSKRGKDKVKKVKMTFYKDDQDDEAKVAFLHSRT